MKLTKEMREMFSTNIEQMVRTDIGEIKAIRTKFKTTKEFNACKDSAKFIRSGNKIKVLLGNKELSLYDFINIYYEIIIVIGQIITDDNKIEIITNFDATKNMIGRAIEIIQSSLKDIDVFNITDNISDIYYTPIANGNIGTLKTSCMTNMDNPCSLQANRYMDIQAELRKNGNDIKILYQKIAEKVSFRALLWTINGNIYLDRCYGNIAAIEAAKRFAIKNGWGYRNSLHGKNFSQFLNTPNSKPIFKFSFEFDVSAMPYLDSFKLIHKNGAVSTYDLGGGMMLSNLIGANIINYCKYCGGFVNDYCNHR